MDTLIGSSPPRIDALDKITGTSAYPGDLVRPGMLYLKVVFARRPHARIRHIITDMALQHPGVVAVLTARDVPHNAYGLISEDQPVLCDDVVRHAGDRVALVVAETKEAAQAGARLVTVRYQDLPVLSDPRKALEPDAPVVHASQKTNLLASFPLRKGNAGRALQDADVVVSGEFRTTWQEHAFLQPEAGIAYLDEQERVVIETAGQWLHEDRRQIASILQLPEEQVVVRYAAIGGAFGGREDLSVQHLLALATWKLRRPTALVWSREDSLIGHHKRHPMIMRCRWGATHEGKLVAVDAHVLADGGAYASTSLEVLKVMALFASGCYEVPHIDVDAQVVYTNNLPAGAMRGFGAPQAQFASELMMERLAHALRIDPVDLRRRNIYREGSIEPTQQPLPAGVSALPVLEQAVTEVKARMGKEAPAAAHLRRGIGIACGIKNVGYSFGFPEQATATVELEGGAAITRALVRVGAAEVGQGTHTALRQIAAEVLTLPPEQITMFCHDSSSTPNAGSASASRLTLMAGRAVHDAARSALDKWQQEERPAVASVQYCPPATTPLNPATRAGRPNYCYAYTTQAAEVEVNTLTGQVRVLRVISAHDVGKVINWQQLTGQIEGAVVQTLGYALMEEFQIQEGQPLTMHFNTYLLPTICDIPEEIVPVVLELADPLGPYGARGVAEMPCVALTSAIAIAIQNAVGVWLDEQPMTPERVLHALHKRVTT